MSQRERPQTYEDEINLYDYWKVIVKRKSLIIGLFLTAVFAAAVISLLMPKIYRGELVLKLPAKELTAKELIGVIGKIDKEKIKNFLPTTHHLVADVKLNVLKDFTDKLQIEQGIKRFKGVEMISSLNISKNPVKPSIKMNIALAGIISLFAGIFLAFFMEYVEKMRKQIGGQS